MTIRGAGPNRFFARGPHRGYHGLMKRPWTVRLARALEDARDISGDVVVNRPMRSVARREMAKRARRVFRDARAWIAGLLILLPG